MALSVDSAEFRSKVYGCWMGKNCGGTLGGPLEQVWSHPDPFDVWWYPKLQEGGIPNDDLEMQLVWLKALEEVGPSLKAADLAQYWLDHIGYNWDEYGLSKTNLRLGLLPPVSGTYNNWFRDCMGCPIRSEIWACIAPGLPRVACRYAYEDAICDHAGGESVYGELFNTAIESAAFVISDRDTLLDIGLSYVPEDSKTAACIRAAREAYADGVDWKEARLRVINASPHHVAQFSPINMGFQVVGWLYGKDFGEAICIAVNCGYDTDCTGATLGSYIGTIVGKEGLPAKWTEPLGESIATNESWGGLRNVSSGGNPVPADLTDLTERVIVAARKTLAYNGYLDGNVPTPTDPKELYADDSIRALWSAHPMRTDYAGGVVSIGVDYLDTPAVAAGTTKKVVTHLVNSHPEEMKAECALRFPDAWQRAAEKKTVTVPATGSVAVEWEIAIPEPTLLENSNRLMLDVAVEGRPAQPGAPIVLIGANRWRIAVVPSTESDDKALFDAPLAPETLAGDAVSPDARPGEWSVATSLDNEIPLPAATDEPCAVYAQTFLWSPEDREVRLRAEASVPAKLWINGTPGAERFDYRPMRPNYGGSPSAQLRAGWNEVLVKFVRNKTDVPFESHLLICSADARLCDGLPDIGRTRLPWD